MFSQGNIILQSYFMYMYSVASTFIFNNKSKKSLTPVVPFFHAVAQIHFIKYEGESVNDLKSKIVLKYFTLLTSFTLPTL